MKKILRIATLLLAMVLVPTASFADNSAIPGWDNLNDAQQLTNKKHTKKHKNQSLVLIM
jgi:hypothetical protein